MTDHSPPEQISIDEAVDANRKYWTDPKLYSFETEILEIDDNWIRLKENYFYPEGGGQPADRGILSLKNANFKVKDVQERAENVWLNLSEHTLQEGMLISAKIDKDRREQISKNHTTQHLFSAAFWDELEYETTRASIGRKETELELNNKPSFEQINNISSIVLDLIEQNLPIASKYYDIENLNKIKLRGEIGKKVQLVRIVEIGDYDKNACGGTHLNNTRNIDSFAITKIDGKRIKFTTGSYAREFNAKIISQVHQLSKLLGTPIQQFKENTEKVLIDKDSYAKKLNKIGNELLQYQLKTAKWRKVHGFELKYIEVTKLENGTILSEFSNLKPDQVVLVVVNENNNTQFVLVTGEESLTKNLMGNLRDRGIKGGGRGTMAMGKTDKDLEKLLENVLKNT